MTLILKEPTARLEQRPSRHLARQSWIARSVEGLRMKRINLFEFYRKGALVAPFGNVSPEDVSFENDFMRIIEIWQAVSKFFEDMDLPLPLSEKAGKELEDAVHEALEAVADESRGTAKGAAKRKAEKIRVAQERLRKFEDILERELAEQETYAVSKKGIFSTPDLVAKAEDTLREVHDSIPEATREDFQQAGRCLAFELPTACGFHLGRATEAALREWHKVLGLPPNRGHWAECVKAITDHFGSDSSPEVQHLLGELDYLRNTYRNRLAHPEWSLSLSEALSYFKRADVVICEMGEQIAAAKS